MALNGEYRCPRCGSPHLRVTSRGFDVGQAVAGRLLLGRNEGLLAGAIGSNKPKLVCVECGYSFYAWDYGKELRKFKEKEEMKDPKERRRVYMVALVFMIVANLVLWLIFRHAIFLAMLATGGIILFVVLIFWIAFAINPPEEPQSKQALQGGKGKQLQQKGKKGLKGKPER